MIPLTLPRRLSVLALAAHPDDVEIGAGGTLLRMNAEVADLDVRVVILTGSDLRAREARDAASSFLPDARLEVQTHELPDGMLPSVWGSVKSILHEVAGQSAPDVILAPAPGDAHQDHRLIAEIVPTEFRDHLILQYEIPKWDGDLGADPATHYVALDEWHIARKCELLEQHYVSQRGRDWFSDETFRGLARLRGMECRAPYAEGFRVPKAVVSFAAEEASHR